MTRTISLVILDHGLIMSFNNGIQGEKQAFEFAKQRIKDGETVAVIKSFTLFGDGSARAFLRVYSKK